MLIQVDGTIGALAQRKRGTPFSQGPHQSGVAPNKAMSIKWGSSAFIYGPTDASHSQIAFRQLLLAWGGNIHAVPFCAKPQAANQEIPITCFK